MSTLIHAQSRIFEKIKKGNKTANKFNICPSQPVTLSYTLNIPIQHSSIFFPKRKPLWIMTLGSVICEYIIVQTRSKILLKSTNFTDSKMN